MLCSVIIPSVGRTTLTRAVESVLKQNMTVSELEVIVVNDSGVPLFEADWHKSEQIQIINTNLLRFHQPLKPFLLLFLIVE